MQDSKKTRYVGTYVYHEGRWYLLQEDVEEILNSEISKAKEEVLETAKEIIDGKSIYSNNGCGTPLELLDWFVESELDKLSLKSKE